MKFSMSVPQIQIKHTQVTADLAQGYRVNEKGSWNSNSIAPNLCKQNKRWVIQL